MTDASTARASTLKVGIDVPWVTSWTAEAVEGPVRCASLGGGLGLHQDSHAGFGRPRYSQNHLDRQRQTVARMLCPMCGEPTPEDDRWTLTAKRRAAGWLRRERGAPIPAAIADDQVLLDAGAIAPLHKACAKRSMVQCPHLKADPDLRLARFPKRWLTLTLMAEADQRGAPPVTAFIQLVGVTETLDRRWRDG